MNRGSGFTLIEMLVTIAVAGILAAIAIPSFNTIVSNSRLTTRANEFVSAINFARTEAIKRGTAVTICRSRTGTTCGGGSGWEDGWIVFADADSNGSLNGTEIPLRTRGAFGSTVNTMRGNGTQFPNRVSFSAQGMVTGQLGGTITVCDTDRATARRVVIAVTGRSRVEVGTCS